MRKPLKPDKNARYGILVHRAMSRYLEGEANRDEAALRDQCFTQAIEQLKQAIAFQPDRYQAHANLATIYARQDKLAEARRNGIG